MSARHAGAPCPRELAEIEWEQAIARRDDIARELATVRAERDGLVAELARTERKLAGAVVPS